DHETDPPMGRGVGVAGEGADSVHGAALIQAAIMAMEQVGVRREELEHLGEASGCEPVVAADSGALLEMDGVSKAARGEHLVRDLKRLLETDRPAQLMATDLQEDLVGGIIVRVEEESDQDLREAARLSVNGDRLQALRHGSNRDFAFHIAAGPSDECGDQLAGVSEADRRVLAKADAALSVRGALGAEPSDRDRGDRSLLLRGDHLIADALSVDRVE